MQKITPRLFVTSVGAASVVPGTRIANEVPAPAASPPQTMTGAGATTPDFAVAHRPNYLFFNAQVVLFFGAACERLIPDDELGAAALAAGVPNYLDKQLGGVWGRRRAAVSQRTVAFRHANSRLSTAVYARRVVSRVPACD